MKLSVIAMVGMLSTPPADLFAQSPPATQSKPTDQELSDLIAKAISNDTTLSADAINVSVKAGVVTLTGVVGKDADRGKAEDQHHPRRGFGNGAHGGRDRSDVVARNRVPVKQPQRAG